MRQNTFMRERNILEIELSDLKGLARLTKKKELESRIAIKNEEIRTLKAGLSGSFIEPVLPHKNHIFLMYCFNWS